MNILASNGQVSIIIFTKCDLCKRQISRGIKSKLTGYDLYTDKQKHICKTCGIRLTSGQEKFKEAFEGNF